ncbi:hypothetical protein [Telmatospirillum sp.]|uniref:phage adaptor protein n=1 Tax=Telmatospirillum sp. TaxID=2079197 RepID=UPI002845016A|nr:hypothetical protein [Telmatospirillum sp.]MDR3439877.1 hypothetical protein [Telmatospirillum sp.]
MALATYDDLKAEIPKFLQNRSDLLPLIDDFISLAQTTINIDLTVGNAEMELPLVAVPGSRFIDISGVALNEPRGLWQTSYNPRQELVFVMPELLTVSTTPGQSTFWTLDGSNIAFNRQADQAYPFAFRFVGNWLLSPTNQTNYLMTNYPNVYLYGSLCEAAPYLSGKDTALIAKWEAKYQKAWKGAQRNLNRWRNALVTSRVDLALQQRRPIFNINQG